MSEYEKQKWLEQLADKYEVPYEQVMLAWVVYDLSMEMYGHFSVVEHFESILVDVFINLIEDN
jgi:hypothetical protein